MSKRRSLVAAVAGVEPEAKVELKQPDDSSPAESKPKPVGILLYVTAEDHERIRNLSFHSRTSLQQLGIEAWSMLLESKGLDPLTKTTATGPGNRRK